MKISDQVSNCQSSITSWHFRCFRILEITKIFLFYRLLLTLPTWRRPFVNITLVTRMELMLVSFGQDLDTLMMSFYKMQISITL